MPEYRVAGIFEVFEDLKKHEKLVPQKLVYIGITVGMSLFEPAIIEKKMFCFSNPRKCIVLRK